MELNSTTLLKVSVQRALLGRVTANVAAITAGLNGGCVTLRAFFFENPSERDKANMECAATEIIADFAPDHTVSIDFRTLGVGLCEMADFWAFVRDGILLS